MRSFFGHSWYPWIWIWNSYFRILGIKWLKSLVRWLAKIELLWWISEVRPRMDLVWRLLKCLRSVSLDGTIDASDRGGIYEESDEVGGW